ncbi:ribosome silencing factor [Myxacorys almedinensis]|uniref:Ribosomal silencing factor RsfS n=1 Tax=Myxacorys almedinensis A TaxID=2690445 RepID=A0A8J7YXS8_9CYAN|nr:ribosome silencing factor [Myxacorys almedinensis]NDJ16514.1 ribosome silencing factor [Myxacorys almedinensis A]
MTNLSNQQTLRPIANPAPQTPDRSYDMALAIAEAADERKGGDIVLLKVGDVSVLADYFVLITGFSKVQVRAIARMIEDNVEEQFNRKPIRSEGLAEGTWVLQDYGDVIVHVMMPTEREYYSLEAFWGHAESTTYAALSLSHDAESLANP